MPEGGDTVGLAISKLGAARSISAEKGVIDETLSRRLKDERNQRLRSHEKTTELCPPSAAAERLCFHWKAVIKIIKRWRVFVFPSKVGMQTPQPKNTGLCAPVSVEQKHHGFSSLYQTGNTLWVCFQMKDDCFSVRGTAFQPNSCYCVFKGLQLPASCILMYN